MIIANFQGIAIPKYLGNLQYLVVSYLKDKLKLAIVGLVLKIDNEFS